MLKATSHPLPMSPSAERNDCGYQERFYGDNLDASECKNKKVYGWNITCIQVI
jgi:hypothetical protein